MLRIRDAVLMLFLGLWAICLYAEDHPEPAKTALEPAKTALEQRVSKYWWARQTRDVRTVYEMESASLPGGWLTPDKASAVTGLPVQNVQIEEITVDGDKGKVRVKADVMVGNKIWPGLNVDDSWVRVDGEWYHETQRP